MSSSTSHPQLHIHTNFNFNFNFNFIFHSIEASGRNSSSNPSNPGPDSDWKKLEGTMVDEICSHPQRDFSQCLAENLGLGDLFEVYLEESSSINKTSREKVSIPFWNTFTSVHKRSESFCSLNSYHERKWQCQLTKLESDSESPPLAPSENCFSCGLLSDIYIINRIEICRTKI